MKKVRSYIKGDSFGDLSLLQGGRSEVSIIADTDLYLQVIDKDTFCSVVSEHALNRKDKMEQILVNVTLFRNNLDANGRSVIGDAFNEIVFPKDHVVFHQGEEMNDKSKF